MVSSEMTEILRMSDRIVVMCEGKKTGELDYFRGYTGKYHEHGYKRD